MEDPWRSHPSSNAAVDSKLIKALVSDVQISSQRRERPSACFNTSNLAGRFQHLALAPRALSCELRERFFPGADDRQVPKDAAHLERSPNDRDGVHLHSKDLVLLLRATVCHENVV